MGGDLKYSPKKKLITEMGRDLKYSPKKIIPLEYLNTIHFYIS